MKWTGLTGGIATGKSTASKLIEGLGIPVIDADQISHKLSEVGQLGYEKILFHFGKDILNTNLSIDRKKLGQIIFSNSRLKSDLENIMHPLIKAEVQLQKKEHQLKGVSLCFYDVPLLFEKKLETNFETIVLIWCNRQTQLQRLMQRNRLTVEAAQLRINSQWSMIDKVKKAHYCLDNSGDQEDLNKQLKNLIKTLSDL